AGRPGRERSDGRGRLRPGPLHGARADRAHRARRGRGRDRAVDERRRLGRFHVRIAADDDDRRRSARCLPRGPCRAARARPGGADQPYLHAPPPPDHRHRRERARVAARELRVRRPARDGRGRRRARARARRADRDRAGRRTRHEPAGRGRPSRGRHGARGRPGAHRRGDPRGRRDPQRLVHRLPDTHHPRRRPRGDGVRRGARGGRTVRPEGSGGARDRRLDGGRRRCAPRRDRPHAEPRARPSRRSRRHPTRGDVLGASAGARRPRPEVDPRIPGARPRPANAHERERRMSTTVGIERRTLAGKDYIETIDWTIPELEETLAVAAELKADRKAGRPQRLLADKTLYMLFLDKSTRTRNAFETGMTQLGGHAIFLDADKTQVSHGESPKDTAMTLSRYGEGIAIRHDLAPYEGNVWMREIARWADIPLINLQCDVDHPTQTLADLMTLREHRGENLRGLKVAMTW